MNQHELAETCIMMAYQNLSGEHDVEFIVLDNGSDEPIRFTFPRMGEKKVPLWFHRYRESIGVYPTFWSVLEHTQAEILAYFHSDLVIGEKGWDARVIKVFENDPRIGLVGFIGSNEIDYNGGRGLGTMSNFQGGEIVNHHTGKAWKGSPAYVHGKVINGLVPSAVVDGCAMIFRRSVLESIPRRMDFPPHHFYDRLLSCEVMEKGFKIATLGIACDHISGQTVNQEPKYEIMAQRWCENHGVGRLPGDHNWDTVVYKTAERYWLREYRDSRHFIPIRV